MFAPVQIKPISKPISQRISAPVKGTVAKIKAPVFHLFNGIFGAYPKAATGTAARTPQGSNE